MRERSGLEKAADFARMCKKLANIMKAAILGGIKGMLMETAKSFAPQILKIAAIGLVILIVLPYLIIATMPNILFGFSDSKSSDVNAMTEKAKIIDEAYKSAKDYNKKEIKSIIEKLSEGYDDVQVEEDLGKATLCRCRTERRKPIHSPRLM